MSGTLEGKLILVTRPREVAGELADMLSARGAQAMVAPSIERFPVPDGDLDPVARGFVDGKFEWAVFTSEAGVDALFSRMEASEARGLRTRVAAVGEGTARALRRFGVEPDLVPSTFTTEALGEALPRGTGKVLLARADIAPEGLDETIGAKGWEPVRVDAYMTRPVGSMPEAALRALREGRVDAVTFTSASTVEGFAEAGAAAIEAAARTPRAVCIGPVTAEAARRAGMTVAAVAKPHTIDGLVAAVERALRQPREPITQER